MIGLVKPLKVRGPRSVENGLGLLLLLLTDVKEEAGLLLAELLGHGTQTRLIHAQLLASLSSLNTELTVLSAETPNALSNLSRLLRALKPQAACRFCACHTHLGLALSKLTVLLSQLAGKLLRAHTHLRCALSDVGLGRSPRETHLPGLLSKLTGELGGVHARAGGKLLDVHTRLGLGLSIGRSELLSREACPCCHFGTRKTELACLKCPGLGKLLCGEAKLTGGLCGLLPLGCKGLRLLSGLLFRRQAQLPHCPGLLGGELFCGKAEAACCLRCPELSFCALRAQSTGELSRLLGSSLLRLKGLLGALRGRFKTLSPELSRGPRLLLQYIPLTLCFLNPLSRAAKGSSTHGLCALSLSCDVALATDVRQRLVNDLLLVRAHELSNRSGVVHPRRTTQGSDALLSGCRAHAACGLELASSICRDAAGARNGLLRLLPRHICGGSAPHRSNAKLLGQSGDRLPHGLLGLGHGLARTVRGLLLRSLTVLGLTRRVNRRSACNVLSAGGGLLQSASLRLADVQTTRHGLAGNVLRRNAGLPQGLLRCPYLTGDRALSGQHVLTANVCKGPCAESRLL